MDGELDLDVGIVHFVFFRGVICIERAGESVVGCAWSGYIYW